MYLLADTVAVPVWIVFMLIMLIAPECIMMILTVLLMIT